MFVPYWSTTLLSGIPSLFLILSVLERVQRYFTRALCKRVGLSHLVILYDCKILIFGHWNTEGCIVTLCSATRLVDLPMEDFFSFTSTTTIYGGHFLKLKPVGSLSVYSCIGIIFITTSYKSVELITIKCH